MKTAAWALTALATTLILAANPLGAAQPEAGEPAPDFRLQDQNGDWHTLEDYRGRWVALYFYPKNDTPGCTTEACAFRDDIFKFKKMGVAIVGVSLDDVASHAEFAEKYHLPFTLLSDAESDTAKAYGVLRNFGLMKVAARETFLIDPEGRIALHYDKVDPDEHSAQVLADLNRLMGTEDATRSQPAG